MNQSIRDLLQNYKPSQEAIEVVRTTKVLLLVGISGAGKDTIKRQLLATNRYHDSVSFTTRPQRYNHGTMEVDGVDYHFVSLDEMIKLLRSGEMIEAKHYSGNIYGSGIRDLQIAQTTNKIALNDIEVQGVAEYKIMSPGVKAIFVLPPDFQEWHRRLIARYNNEMIDPADLSLRIKTAADELRTALDSDYFCFVVNDTVARAVEQIEKISKDEMDESEARRGREIAGNFLKSLC